MLVSEENVELARIATRDLRTMFEFFDEDIVWDNRQAGAPADMVGVHTGKRDVTRMIERWVGTWLNYTFGVDELIDAGEHVLLGVRETGLGKGSRIPMEHRFWMAWTLRDERVVRCAVYDDLAQARRALGLAR
jgi:ketosteroid isomerase-like protein